MWDVYVHSRIARLPRFWQEAFEAAYEELAGDDPSSRDAATSEIARMSMRMADPEPNQDANVNFHLKPSPITDFFSVAIWFSFSLIM